MIKPNWIEGYRLDKIIECIIKRKSMDFYTNKFPIWLANFIRKQGYLFTYGGVGICYAGDYEKDGYVYIGGCPCHGDPWFYAIPKEELPIK